MDFQADLNLIVSYNKLTHAPKHLKSGKPVMLHQQGKPVAALISLEDLKLFQRLVQQEEDRIDIAEADAAEAEGGEGPWEDVKAQLNL